VERRQQEIQDDQVGGRAPGLLQGVEAVAAGGHGKTRALEIVGQQFEDVLVVFNDKNGVVGHGSRP